MQANRSLDMKKQLAMILMLLFAGAMTRAAVGQARLGQPPLNCDRACLNGLADSYLAALVAHDAKRAAIAPNAKFTENAQVLPFTEGLWKNATQAPSKFKIYVA